MTTQLTQDALERHLWTAADFLRNSTASHNAEKYLLALLFLKRLSDRFDEESEVVSAEGGNPEDPDEYQFFVPPVARWQRLVEVAQNIGDELNNAVAALEQSNPKLEGILYGFNFNSVCRLEGSLQRDAILGTLVRHFSEIDLRNSNLSEVGVLGNIYDSLIARIAGDGSRGGEFLTPKGLARLIVEILQPREGMRIYDPACGAGSLLNQCADYVRRQGGNPRNLILYGQEINSETWSFCKMNMLLHGTEHDIRHGDTIRDPKFIEGDSLILFDIVLSNPPISVSNWGSEFAVHDPWRRFRFGMPPRNNGDFAFLQHMIATLAPRGRMGVLTTQGVLSRGKSEADIRRQLITNDLIEAVIALPPGVLPYTSVAPAVIVINRAKSPDRAGAVFFVDATRTLEQFRGSREFRELDQHLAGIPEAVAGYCEQDGYSKSVLIDEIASHGFSLRPSTYLFKSPHGERLDRIASILQSRIRRTFDSESPDIPVVQGRDLSIRRLSVEDLAHWQTPSDLSRAIFVEPGDILIQRIGDKPKAALATGALDGTLASDTVFVIRVREEHRPMGPYLVGFLNSPEGQKRLVSARTSSVIPSLSLSGLRSLRVPLPDAKLLSLLERVLGIEEEFYDRDRRILNLRSKIFETHDATDLEAEARQLSLDAGLLRESVVRSEDLGFQIRNFYPHMVAYCYRRSFSIFDPERRYRQQLAVLDAVVPFLGSVGLLLATSLGKPAQLGGYRLGREVLLNLWTGGASLGKWVSICRDTARFLKAEAGAPASRAFSSMWSKSLDRTLGDLIEQRNDDVHRPKAWSKREFDRQADEVQSKIEEVLKASLFFVQHPIRLVEDVSVPWREQEVILSTLAYSGDHPSLRREQIRHPTALTEGHLYLELAPGSWLSLYPLLSVEELGGERRTYAVDKLRGQRRLGLRTLEDGREATPAHVERIGEDFWQWLDGVYES